MSPPDDRPLRETDRPRARSRWFPGQRTRAGGSAPLRPPCQPPAVRVAAEAPATMFNQQLQQQQLQQQQLLQLQQLLQQSPPQAPLPMAVSRGLPQQQPQQQLLNLQGANSASLLNGSVLQRALLLQQLQGLDQFAMPPATYDSSGLTMPTATLGNLRGYSLATPNLTPPSLTPPQLATPNLQQFFPQATRQSLLGPPPVGVPMNPSQINLSGRTPQKQARAPTSSTPHRKTTPMEDESDPPEGSEEAVESRTNMPKDQGSPPCPDDIMKEKRTLAPTPESCEASEPPAKRSKSSELPTEKGPPGQLQAKVPPRARTTAPKQTQTPELLPEPPEARVLPRFQPRVLQIQAQVQPQTPPLTPPVDTPARHQPQKQAQTQTSPEHVGPRPGQEGVGPQKQARPQAPSQAPGQVQTQLQKQAQTQTYPQVQPPDQPRGHPPAPSPGQPPDQTEGRLQPPPRVPVPTVEPAPELLPDKRDTAAGPEKASPEPGGAQVSMESQDELTGGLDVGECEKRAREMLGVWGAGGSLKVTILQSSDSRAFSTIPITPVPRAGDSASTAPAAASTPSKQTLQFFCYLCKANCSSQQEFQNHMSGTQHQQRLGELQHTSQACLLSLLPVPRDVLEREDEEPPPRRWCNTCQLYYMGDLIQHRRTQDHKIAKQSLRPFCTICNRYFKTPRKFVEHVKSQGHKDKAEELKMLEKETAGQDEDHFITVDAVGCFEGDEEEEEDDDDEEEEIEVEEEFCKQVRSRDISIEEWKGSETYSPNTAYGVDFLVPVMGYMCRICHKFYHSNSGAQLSHCKSLAHFENLQKYKKAKNPSPTSRPMSRRCAINARNALTALFTSGGRTPTQPSTQDPAKTPSKPRSPEPTFGISQSRPEPYSPALPRLPNPARKSTAQKSSGQTPRPRPESRPL
ncbi:cip1-interacting zinc finger protein isoform X2 [Mustela lutreola]|uniref:cip1-interacting zinc finger protein isoform X2 n=1 Tax=Mustela lutreola TaxID=9666 RepID=UPI00279761DD|nr:cip1-interacting zinc finger protein isoform X2 [Mustela lutreola]